MRLGEPIHKEIFLNLTYVYEKLNNIVQGTDELPNPNALRTIQNSFLLDLDYGVTQRLTITGSLPVQFVDGNTPFLNGKNSGIGDISILGKYKVIHPIFKTAPTVSLNFGFRIPSGSIEEKIDGNRLPDRVQIGSGIFSLIVGAESFFRTSRKNSFFGSISSRISFGENKYDYKTGNDFQTSLGNSLNIVNRLDLTTQVNFIYFAPNKINSQLDESTGGKLLYFTPGVQFSVSDNLFFRTQVRFSLYKNVKGLQFLSDQTLVTSMGYRFNY